MSAALLASYLVLASAGDWVLAAPGQREAICATSRETCETARSAVERGVIFRDLPARAGWRCVPHPGCLSPESECIPGYNCR